jgi:hypothetical protein
MTLSDENYNDFRTSYKQYSRATFIVSQPPVLCSRRLTVKSTFGHVHVYIPRFQQTRFRQLGTRVAGYVNFPTNVHSISFYMLSRRQ